MFNFKNQRLLVVAPHPDDEVLGCGGLIKRVKDSGGKVYVIFLTVGNSRDFSKLGGSTRKEREKEIVKVASFLRFNKYDIIFKGNKYHLRLDSLGQKEIMQIIERDSQVSIEKIKPDMVVFPSLYSYNQDHRLAAYATHAALRPSETSGKYFIPYVLAYETPADGWSLNSQTLPNFFVGLTHKHIKAKIKAMSLYSSQVRPPPNLRSLEMIESFARLRGAYAATEFAEGYIMYRGIY